jgi:NADH/NAD ratio-sensing transcriptional regulator Rex
MTRPIPAQTIKRLGRYLTYLKSLPANSSDSVSATTMANALGLGEIQVRKDLSLCVSAGSPKVGRNRAELIRNLEIFLGLTQPMRTIYIGDYPCNSWITRYCGTFVDILGFFRTVTPRRGFAPLSRVGSFCRENSIQLCIVDVEPEHLIDVRDVLLDCEIPCIWNLSPAPIESIEDVLICNDGLCGTLSTLAYQIRSTQTN